MHDALVLLPSLPYHTHILRRSAHTQRCASLTHGFVAPFGGSRDKVHVHLERVTSGPPSARPPTVFLCGPPHSGRSSILANFARTSHRCSAQRRLDHNVDAESVFPHRGRGAENATWERDVDQGLIVPAFMVGGGAGLRAALEYIAMEIALQRKGVDAFSKCMHMFIPVYLFINVMHLYTHKQNMTCPCTMNVRVCAHDYIKAHTSCSYINMLHACIPAHLRIQECTAKFGGVSEGSLISATRLHPNAYIHAHLCRNVRL